MRKTIFTLLSLSGLLFLFISAKCQQPGTWSFDNRTAVEEWIKENHIAALGIGILREGKLREIRMYGEIKTGDPAPYNAIFNVASLTKPVVAMLTLKLVSNGAWNLDEPLSNYWVDPDIKDDPRHKKLTTRLVLSHQTGFKNWRYLNKDNKLAFDTTPGTRYGYSGEGFEYLRKALEKKFNKGIEQLTDSLIFRPLGMNDTRHAWDRFTDESRFVHWYDKNGDEYKRDYKATSISAADDLLTTIEDYGKFAANVLQGGNLDSSVFNQMIRPHVPTGDGRYFGLGWEMFLDLGPKKEYALTHGGSDVGVRTLLILLPVSKQGLIIFTNSDNGNKLHHKLITEWLDTGKELMSRVK
jgi:CubicO group peptidase (beta-lactamase class C family)